MSNFLEKFQDPDELQKLIEYAQTGNKAVITEKMAEKLERVSTADGLIRQYGTRKRVIEIMKVRFRGLSEASLIRDYYDAKKVFNASSYQQREYDRELWYQWLMESALKAKNVGDDEMFNKLANTAYKYGQFDKEEDDAAQMHVEEHDVEVVFDLELLGVPDIKNVDAKKAYLKQKISRKNNNWYQGVEDAEFEDED